MTFHAELKRLADAATQGEWLVLDIRPEVERLTITDGKVAIARIESFVSGRNIDSGDIANAELIALLANRRREILALVELAWEARHHMDTLSSACCDEQLKATYIHLGDRITEVFRNLDRAQEGSNVPG